MSAPLIGFRAPNDPGRRETYARDLAAGGFNWMEIGCDAPAEADAAAVRLAGELNLAVSLHCHFVDVNLSSLVPPVRQNAMDVIRGDLERAARLGSRVAVVHGGDIGWFDFLPLDHPDYAENQAVIDRLFPRHQEALAESLAALSGRACTLGIRLVAENMYMPWEVLKRPDEVPFLPVGVDLCLDFGHARVAGFVPEEFPAERVGHTHIHWNDGRYDLHKPLMPELAGAYRAIVTALAVSRPDTCLLLELPSRSVGDYQVGMAALTTLLQA
ncbi:MAG TPA: TIM barrel protein [Symbiobacteriaceae bacterium]|jgi:sugar phosphate isomerase/epimerase